MTIRINPLDTFFFRDGKPFTMGAETWTDSLFPPAPSVFYGALRSYWLSNQEGSFSNENILLSEKLKIKGVFIEINGKVHLPVPKDFVQEKEGIDNFLLTDNLANCISSKPLIAALLPKKKSLIVEEISTNSLFQINTLKQYLRKENIEYLYVIKDLEYLVKESKIGISRHSDTRTTDEGLLYRVDFNRFMNDLDNTIAFVVECEGLEFPQEGKIRLGGEGKLAHFETISQYISPESFQGDKSFKLYLATTSIFNKGWLPNWINETTLISEDVEDSIIKFGNLKIKLIAASIGKPISIGGFDLKKGEPKPMYKAVPAGSVYHFELIEGDMNKVIELFHDKNISDVYSEQGFGLTYIGKA